MSLFKSLFGPKTDYRELLSQGAVIVDVRSEGEFRGGHIKGSKNIPLDQLSSKASKLPKDKAIICCCASGVRSGSAKGMLKSKGFQEVYNGGGWRSLQSKIS
ncbi:MAG: rhodanese-like domain-containing protein [Bacteroidetes bacterium]|nr:MAG: rhodanese-like domain-containing protein [Bacteroidota bacterium]